jgi:hypothetical protein
LLFAGNRHLACNIVVEPDGLPAAKVTAYRLLHISPAHFTPHLPVLGAHVMRIVHWCCVCSLQATAT